MGLKNAHTTASHILESDDKVGKETMIQDCIPRIVISDVSGEQVGTICYTPFSL